MGLFFCYIFAPMLDRIEKIKNNFKKMFFTEDVEYIGEQLLVDTKEGSVQEVLVFRINGEINITLW